MRSTHAFSFFPSRLILILGQITCSNVIQFQTKLKKNWHAKGEESTMPGANISDHYCRISITTLGWMTNGRWRSRQIWFIVQGEGLDYAEGRCGHFQSLPEDEQTNGGRFPPSQSREWWTTNQEDAWMQNKPHEWMKLHPNQENDRVSLKFFSKKLSLK